MPHPPVAAPCPLVSFAQVSPETGLFVYHMPHIYVLHEVAQCPPSPAPLAGVLIEMSGGIVPTAQSRARVVGRAGGVRVHGAVRRNLKKITN